MPAGHWAILTPPREPSTSCSLSSSHTTPGRREGLACHLQPPADAVAMEIPRTTDSGVSGSRVHIPAVAVPRVSGSPGPFTSLSPFTWPRPLSPNLPVHAPSPEPRPT
ncbi:hypothetical protein AAFF_G00353280 [Aldrovandia affinis]|uniref:Uncharacterized protein n=1 Tax=Aldrovandia affinis TaxID=143900 RepID=A0AAD7R5C4_9TELE|nr:hypothetical protein AAFF_G00353280 [Aldrovandia affinis]